MRLLLALSLLAATPAAARDPAPTADPGRLAAARQLVSIMTPEAQRNQRQAAMLDQIMGPMIAGMLQGQPGFQQALQQHPQLQPIIGRFISKTRLEVLADLSQHMPEFIDAQAIAYARLYSIDELKSLAAFFATPAGQKFVTHQADILKQPEVAEWQRAFALRNQQRSSAEVEALKRDVEAAVVSEGKNSTHGS